MGGSGGSGRTVCGLIFPVKNSAGGVNCALLDGADKLMS